MSGAGLVRPGEHAECSLLQAILPALPRGPRAGQWWGQLCLHASTRWAAPAPRGPWWLLFTPGRGSSPVVLRSGCQRRPPESSSLPGPTQGGLQHMRATPLTLPLSPAQCPLLWFPLQPAGKACVQLCLRSRGLTAGRLSPTLHNPTVGLGLEKGVQGPPCWPIWGSGG